MVGRAWIRRDPFEGTGAYRRRFRLQVESSIALALAVIACGITAAMWFRTLSPLFDRIALN